MKSKVLLFWLCLIMWGVLAILMTVFSYQYAKETWTIFSYFWCGVFAFGCGVGTIFFPAATMINIIFTLEGNENV